MTAESKKLQEVCSYLTVSNIEHVLVGEHIGQLLDDVAGDVDIVLSRKDINCIHELVSDVCNETQMQCVQVLQHEQRAFYFVLAWVEKPAWHYLRLDFCDDYLRSARLLMSARELLDGRIKDPDSGFYIPHPKKNLLYYLVKKIDKGEIDEAQFSFLRQCLSGCKESDRAEFFRFWTKEYSEKILQILESNAFDAFNDIIPALRQPLRIACKPSMQSRLGEFKRLVSRILRPTGVFIAIYGPDGSGKSSVIEALKPRLLPAFRRTLEFHFRPYVGYPQNDEVVTVPDPHGQKARHPVTSVLKLFYYVADYVAGYLLNAMPARIRATLVVFDRYYDDLIIDPRRYCYGGPKFLLKWLRPFIPKPDLVFCLDADPEILQARKKEVSFAECTRQREAYRDLAAKLPKGHVIDVSQPLEDVVRDVQSIVLNFMAERTAKRFGNA